MEKIRCFVAMPFGKEDADFIYENWVKKVLIDSNMLPIRVDRIVHNERIDQKIRNETLKCHFMIADLTYSRPSPTVKASS